MLDQVFYLSKAAGIAELIVIAIGIIALAVPAIWNRFTGPRPPSQDEISLEAEGHLQRHGEATISRIATRCTKNAWPTGSARDTGIFAKFPDICVAGTRPLLTLRAIRIG